MKDKLKKREAAGACQVVTIPFFDLQGYASLRAYGLGLVARLL